MCESHLNCHFGHITCGFYWHKYRLFCTIFDYVESTWCRSADPAWAYTQDGFKFSTGISVLHTTIRILSSTFVHDCCSHSWKYVSFLFFYGQRDRDLDDDQVTSLLSSDRGARGNTAAEMQGQVFGGTRWPCHIRHFLSEVWVAAWVFWGKLFSRFL